MEYKWRAHYLDGTELAEVDGDKYEEIDRSRLKSFVLETVSGMPIVITEVPEGCSLLWRRRNIIQSIKGKLRKTIVHLVGWRSAIDTNLAYLFPDGCVVLGTEDLPIHEGEILASE